MNAAKRAKETKREPKRAKREPKMSQGPSKTSLRNRVAKVSKRGAKSVSAALAFESHLDTDIEENHRNAIPKNMQKSVTRKHDKTMSKWNQKTYFFNLLEKR